MEWQLGKMRMMVFSYTLVYPLLVNVPGHSLHGVVVVAVVVFVYNFTALLSFTQGVLSLSTSVTFDPPRPSELRQKLTSTNSTTTSDFELFFFLSIPQWQENAQQLNLNAC